MRAPTFSNLIKGTVAGLVGGLAATWVMTQFQNSVPPDTFERLLGQDSGSDESEEDDSPAATVLAADELSQLVRGRGIPEEQEELAGQLVHYLFGTASGKVYGMAAEVFPEITRGFGLPFGAAFWLTADETMVPALGLSDPPWEHPPAMHLYSLAAHLVYGLTLETVRRAVRSSL